MAPVETNFPPRGPKIVLGRRLLGATDDDEARVSLSGIHRCGGADPRHSRAALHRRIAALGHGHRAA